MSGFSDKVRHLWKKSLTGVEKASSSLYHNTKFKVSELNLLEQRKTLMTDIASKVYELYQKGEALPDALQELLVKVVETDEALNSLQMERHAFTEANRQASTSTEEADAPQTPADEPDAAEGTEARADDLDVLWEKVDASPREQVEDSPGADPETGAEEPEET